MLDTIRDENGELIGFAKVTRDLTERQLEQTRLLESERRFRHLVQAVIDYAIFQLDPSGIVVTWNAGAERIKGYRPNEIIGEHFSRFYPDDDREQPEFHPEPWPQPPAKEDTKRKARAYAKTGADFGRRS